MIQINNLVYFQRQLPCNHNYSRSESCCYELILLQYFLVIAI